MTTKVYTTLIEHVAITFDSALAKSFIIYSVLVNYNRFTQLKWVLELSHIDQLLLILNTCTRERQGTIHFANVPLVQRTTLLKRRAENQTYPSKEDDCLISMV